MTSFRKANYDERQGAVAPPIYLGNVNRATLILDKLKLNTNIRKKNTIT